VIVMNTSSLAVGARHFVLIACLCSACAAPAIAQNSEGARPHRADDRRSSAQEQREHGIARCRENRGVDCDTPEGQKEWVLQERPITDQERAQAAAARRAREAATRR